MEQAYKEPNGSVTDNNGYRWLYDVYFGKDHVVSGFEESDADSIVKACNDHDTLKAKEKLFDEAFRLVCGMAVTLNDIDGRDDMYGYREDYDILVAKEEALK